MKIYLLFWLEKDVMAGAVGHWDTLPLTWWCKGHGAASFLHENALRRGVAHKLAIMTATRATEMGNMTILDVLHISMQAAYRHLLETMLNISIVLGSV
jgi:hypothetical protein